ncbi:MAG: DUF6984 family protein [Solirubrobacterales bacterium]
MAKRAEDKTGFRSPSDAESAVLQRLLSEHFSGRDALLDQLPTLRVRQIDEQGSLKLKVIAPTSRAEDSFRVPVEAELPDLDGMAIHLSLHVVNGVMDELEIYREDSGLVKRQLSPEELRLIVLDSPI